jgi:exonuclease III
MSGRPERRTALVSRELARYGVEIAALSETRFADKGQLTEIGGGYTFFWSGRSSEERREAGVGFAIKDHIMKKLDSIPEGLSDRLMKLRLPLGKKKFATLISAYAPTMTNPDETKDKFYEELEALISTVPQSDKLILLGDFNARVGRDYHAWEGVIGHHGVGKCNSNGLLLLRTCATYGLAITNTMFRLPTRNKTSWMHPRSKHWHLIDYIIVRAKDMPDVRVTKAMVGADCWTDHRLIISKTKLLIQPSRRPQGQKVAKRLNVNKLKLPSAQEELSTAMSQQLPEVSSNDWDSLKTIVHSVALQVLGPKTRNHQDWFDENDAEIQTVLEEKRLLHKAHRDDPNSVPKKDAYDGKRNEVQRKLRTMQDTWLSNKADEIQGYADAHDVKRFYDSLKCVYGPSTSGSSPMFNADGSTLITDKNELLERWAEHFDGVLNRPSSINDEAIERLPQVDTNEALAIPPTDEEVEKAVKQMSTGKAPGPDAIPAEVYKSGGPALNRKLTEMFHSVWESETLPQDFKDATIVHIYKRKGNKRSCDNHRGISLLSIAGKILARVLLNRLLDHLEQGHLPESQCGFRSGRGTIDMVFAARQLQEKSMEQHQDLYMTFVDLTKAFDTVSREGLWRIMSKFGCPDKFVHIVKQFHDGMTARVLDDGGTSDSFPVTNGVKQGCVLAPTLFSMMFSAMLMDAFRESTPGIPIRYRCDGKLFNPRRLQAVTKVKETVIRDLLFADDCALNATREQEMQQEMDKFSSACDNFGLTISTKKTEVLHQPAPGKQYQEPSITVNGQRLQAVEHFTYLGSTLSRSANIDAEVNNRVAKASGAFGRLRKTVWERRGIRQQTKVKVYKAVVLTTLLYGCETWTIYRRHEKQLQQFHVRCLRNIFNIRWQDRIPDTEVLERAELPSIITTMRKAQTRWAGHVSRMTDSRIPKQLFYGELSNGERKVGGQRKRYKDTLKVYLKDFDIDAESWESSASDRPAWRTLINKGACHSEARRMETTKEKRKTRKERAANAANIPPTHWCQTCGKGFHARIGLIGHSRTHRSNT